MALSSFNNFEGGNEIGFFAPQGMLVKSSPSAIRPTVRAQIALPFFRCDLSCQQSRQT
jgi:hypothetical protein